VVEVFLAIAAGFTMWANSRDPEDRPREVLLRLVVYIVLAYLLIALVVHPGWFEGAEDPAHM
jgi:hypothetical protein